MNARVSLKLCYILLPHLPQLLYKPCLFATAGAAMHTSKLALQSHSPHFLTLAQTTITGLEGV